MSTCKIQYDGWDWANKITVVSPSGKGIHLRAYWGESVSQQLEDLFTKWNQYWVDSKFGSGVQVFEEELSTTIMKELLDLSKKPITYK